MFAVADTARLMLVLPTSSVSVLQDMLAMVQHASHAPLENSRHQVATLCVPIVRLLRQSAQQPAAEEHRLVYAVAVTARLMLVLPTSCVWHVSRTFSRPQQETQCAPTAIQTRHPADARLQAHVALGFILEMETGRDAHSARAAQQNQQVI